MDLNGTIITSDERIMQAEEDLPHETLEAYESLSEKEKLNLIVMTLQNS